MPSTNMADSPDVNKGSKRRGRPKGSKNKTKQPQSGKNSNTIQNYTLGSLRERKERSLEQEPMRAQSQTAPALEVCTETDSAASPAVPLTHSHDDTTTTQNNNRASTTTSSPQNPSISSHHTQMDGIESGSSPLAKGDHSSLSGSPPAYDTGAILQQLVDRISGMEDKLTKLDSMESKITKMDVNVSKTSNMTSDVISQIQDIKSSVVNLDQEITSIKETARSNEEKMVQMEQDLATLKAKVNSQEDREKTRDDDLRSDILSETQKHFNGFTRHLEQAFIKEQAANRKQNLIFTGIPEVLGQSDFTTLRDIFKVGLGLDKVLIDTAFRTQVLRAGAFQSRPLFVRFKFMVDRTRVWRAKKKLQQGDYNHVWIQEDMPRELKEDLRIMLRIAKQAEILNKEEYKDLRVRGFQVHLAGQSYHPSQLETLPLDLRPSSICTKRSEEAIVFFGRYSPLSNHHCSPFTLEGAYYVSVEHFLAVKRATLSGDQDLLEKARGHTNPADSKGILNILREDHVQEWEETLSKLLLSALRGKFTQNQLLGTYLRVTYPLYLGEASRDQVWGIGFNFSENGVPPYSQWASDGNLLGRSLSKIRGELIQELGLP